MTDRPSNFRTLSDWTREILYPLGLFLAIGSLWGYAWAQRSTESTAYEYYPPIAQTMQVDVEEDQAPQPSAAASPAAAPASTLSGVATIQDTGF